MWGAGGLVISSQATKIRRINRPGIAICEKLADSENICVWTYEKGPRSIRLDPESHTYILDDYDDYWMSHLKLLLFLPIYGLPCGVGFKPGSGVGSAGTLSTEWGTLLFQGDSTPAIVGDAYKGTFYVPGSKLNNNRPRSINFMPRPRLSLGYKAFFFFVG